MRSRNGNHSFTRRFCSIILLTSLTSLALNASEYLISYKYIVKNATLYNEALDISKSMSKCMGIPQQSIILPSSNKKNLKKIIKENREIFIDYISQIGLNIKNKQISTNNQIDTISILTFKTSCFKVDFNDNFVKISYLK